MTASRNAWRTLGVAAIIVAVALTGLAAAAPKPEYPPPVMVGTKSQTEAWGAGAAAAPTKAATSPPPASQCGPVRTRRALQSLSQADRDAFVLGVQKLRQAGVIDRMNRRHRLGMKWHGTPLFMPMHRALMKEFEDELLKVAPTLSGVPYWDELQDTKTGIQSSAIWSNSLMGPLVNGPLQGPFKGFKDDYGQLITRAPLKASAGFSWLPSSQVMATVLQRMTTFGNFSGIVEVSPHNQFHVLVGGTMGDTTVSPGDPVFWSHHAYIDLLWALWQSLSPNNVDRLDAPFNGKPSIPLDAPVVLYEKQYTNRDMTRYRTRLCYQYIVPTTTAPKKVKRDAQPEHPVPEPQPNTQSGLPAASMRIKKRGYGKCTPPPKPEPHFTAIEEMPAEALAKVMPMKPIEEIRAAEHYVNDVTTELNTKIANHEVDPARIPCINELFEKYASGEPPADDFQQSLVFKQSVPEPAPAPAPAPTATHVADYGYYAPPPSQTTAAVDASPVSTTVAFEQQPGAVAVPTVSVDAPQGQTYASAKQLRAAVTNGASDSRSSASAIGVVVALLATALFAFL